MKKITEFNKPVLNNLRNEFQDDLDKLSKKYGIDFHLGNCSYAESNATFKLEMKIKGGLSRQENDLRRYTQYKPNQKVNVLGLGSCEVIGFKSRNIKYPLIVKALKNGNSYKIRMTDVEAA